MMDFVATEPTWVVLPDLKHFGAVDVGQQFTSEQTVEVFTDEATARERALAVGWTEDLTD